jgi:hypothetical protein
LPIFWPLYCLSFDHCIVYLLAIVLSIFWPLYCLSFGHCIVYPVIFLFCLLPWYLETLLQKLTSQFRLSLYLSEWLLLTLLQKLTSQFRVSLYLSEWLLFNAKWAIFQPYQSENKLYLYEMMMMMMCALC